MWNPVALGEGEFARTNQAVGQRASRMSLFVTLGDGAKDFSEEEVAPNATVVSYLPYKEYIPQMDYVIHHGGAGIFYQCIEFKNQP